MYIYCLVVSLKEQELCNVQETRSSVEIYL